MALHAKKLHKQLGFLEIFCIATGAMISSGIFILPGLAYAQAGPAVIFSYFLASLLCVPTVLSISELTTAMPKAGGDYFYIMKGFGPPIGTIAGFCSWFSISLKAAFALVGVGAYMTAWLHVPMPIIAVFFCLLFTLLNIIGVREAGRFQVLLVLGLLVVLVLYGFRGLPFVEPSRFAPFFSRGAAASVATASFVFISYGGMIKLAALAEEVEEPGRNMPLSLMLSLAVTTLLYLFVIFVTVGTLGPVSLAGTLTPLSDAAAAFGGRALKFIVDAGALLAFISTANAGIMTASRYPLGMSRDRLLPSFFQKVAPTFKTPYASVLMTGAFMTAVILLLKLELLVKVASSILILLFIFANVTVVLFRESKISAYKPRFRSFFYPTMQVIGILGGIFLLIEMGSVIVFLSLSFMFLGFVWYKIYAEKRVSTDSALLYALQRLVSKDKELLTDTILTELKDIVVERDKITEDRFHRIIEQSDVLDIENVLSAEDLFRQVSHDYAAVFGLPPEALYDKLIRREEASSTVLRHGLAVPHIIVPGERVFKVVLARSRKGVVFSRDEVVHAIFIIMGSADERSLHLKSLAAIAQITQNPGFDQKWMQAVHKEELKHIVLLAERRRA